MAQSFVVPRFRNLNSNTIIYIDGLPQNPVEVSPINFKRILGLQRITVIDLDTEYTFSFEVEGGINSLSGGYISLIDANSNYYLLDRSPVGCTVTTTSTNNLSVVTPAADNGGRTYVFVFSPFATTQPTIEKTAGAALAGDLQVTVSNILFYG